MDLNKFLGIALPIIASIIGLSIQRWYLKFKTQRFKLIDHPLFADILLSIYDLQNWNPKQSRLVFIEALRIQLVTWHDEGIKLVSELENKSFSSLQLQNVFLLWTLNVTKLYTNLWDKNKIPKPIIKRMTGITDENIKSFMSEITTICYNNDMYPFKNQKIIAILNTLRLLLADTKNDFNKLIYRDKYNGEFKGISYNEIPINDDEFDIYLTKYKINN